MKVYIVQGYAAIIMGVYESKKEAQANLQDGWYVTAYEVKKRSNNKREHQ